MRRASSLAVPFDCDVREIFPTCSGEPIEVLLGLCGCGHAAVGLVTLARLLAAFRIDDVERSFHIAPPLQFLADLADCWMADFELAGDLAIGSCVRAGRRHPQARPSGHAAASDASRGDEVLTKV